MLLNSQVLVLNRLWQAVNICSARRAFALVYAGHAQVVATDGANNFLTHDFDSWRDFSAQSPEPKMVTTISWKIRVPRVIVLLLFDRLPKKEVKFTRHNVFERKGNRLPHEAHMTLIRKPKRPKWRPFVQVTFTTQQHESWRHFVDLAYWNVELSD
ncbi:MAG: HNH endonuclease [Verrucomicrobia bacterium]|nr:MAG: HNH endonuclease [Verrucomicrobiota bacterium]